MNSLYAEERRGQKLKDLTIRREERRQYREQELEAAKASIQQQRQEHAIERQFLQNYASEAALAAADAQAWAIGAQQRRTQQLSNQDRLQAELQAAQKTLLDEQTLLHNERVACRQHEAHAARLRQDTLGNLSSLQRRLHRETEVCEAMRQRLPQLRHSLQTEEACVEAEVLTAQRRCRRADEALSEAEVLESRTKACRGKAEASSEEILHEAAEHRHLAYWERTLLEAHSTEQALKMEAFEQRRALERRSHALSMRSQAQPEPLGQVMARLGELAP
eukprot:TRINITY_DN88479_c0_g1_i1.p1 TRINITY_DN88479_c0_g1~~TRINITY_DN88479_c0_g1_i1.p1  ORF type:complete len:277 (+),score=77.10 TRINITY_DN88479_c0_g1_i1:128-958(+)